MSIAFGSNTTVVPSFWTTFKTNVANKGLLMQYQDDGTTIGIFAFDGFSLAYNCTIWNGSVPASVLPDYSQSQNDTDKTDFNNNFKPSCNKAMGASDKTGNGTLTGNGQTVVAPVNSCASILIDVTGTFVLGMTVEADNGDGNWISVQGISPVSGNTFGGSSQPFQLSVNTGGYARVRVRCTSYTSGTATVTWNAGQGINFVSQGVAASNPSGWPFKLTDGSNVAAVKAASTSPLAADPAVVVVQGPNRLNTYSAAILNLTPAASATDVFTITGAANVHVRVLHVEVWAAATASGTSSIQLIKRSTLDTGGTSATVTAVPHSSNNAAAVAGVKSYTANPSGLGTAVGAVRTAKALFAAAGALATPVVWDADGQDGQLWVLESATECYAVNLNASTPTGASLNISITWTEE